MSSLYEDLQGKLQARRAVIGVCGLGYVGLPLAIAIAAKGFRVVGFDVDQTKVEGLNQGRSYIHHISSEVIGELLAGGRFEATADFGVISSTDVVVICVPTPLTKFREPDLSFVVNTATTVADHARRGQLVVLESTTYPGTTSEVVKPIFEERGFADGTDIFLAFSPEREDPGNPNYGTTTIPKVVGADDGNALKLATSLYGHFVSTVIPVSSSATAEAVKLTENIFRAVNIALVNELKLVYTAMGIDIWEVIEAAKTKPFGFMPFYPGPGLGGHCIPIDPFYLTWKAREYEIATHFIELAGEINNAMPQYVVHRLAEALDRQFRRGLNGAKVLILGIAYKKNIGDVRESASFKLIELLEERGAIVDYYDPFVPVIPPTREHAALSGRKSVALAPETVREFDAVIIATDHDDVDYAMVVDEARMVVDTRNACRNIEASHGRIVKA